MEQLETDRVWLLWVVGKDLILKTAVRAQRCSSAPFLGSRSAGGLTHMRAWRGQLHRLRGPPEVVRVELQHHCQPLPVQHPPQLLGRKEQQGILSL